MAANVNVNLKYPEYNADGTPVFYGNASDLVDRGNHLSTMMGPNVSSFNVDWNDVKLGTDATHLFVLSYHTYLPKNAVIEAAEFVVTSTWDSTSSDVTLSFGLVKMDATNTTNFTIVAATSIFSAIAKTAIDTLGAKVWALPADSLPAAATYTGAAVGTALTENDLVTVSWGNHAPTQGAGILRVYWRANLAQ